MPPQQPLGPFHQSVFKSTICMVQLYWKTHLDKMHHATTRLLEQYILEQYWYIVGSTVPACYGQTQHNDVTS